MPKAIIIFLCIILFVVIGWNYFRTKNGGMIEGLDASANTTAPSSSGTTTTAGTATGSGTGTATGTTTGTATGSGTGATTQSQSQQAPQSNSITNPTITLTNYTLGSVSNINARFTISTHLSEGYIIRMPIPGLSPTSGPPTIIFTPTIINTASVTGTGSNSILNITLGSGASIAENTTVIFSTSSMVNPRTAQDALPITISTHAPNSQVIDRGPALFPPVVTPATGPNPSSVNVPNVSYITRDNVVEQRNLSLTAYKNYIDAIQRYNYFAKASPTSAVDVQNALEKVKQAKAIWDSFISTHPDTWYDGAKWQYGNDEYVNKCVPPKSTGSTYCQKVYKKDASGNIVKDVSGNDILLMYKCPWTCDNSGGNTNACKFDTDCRKVASWGQFLPDGTAMPFNGQKYNTGDLVTVSRNEPASWAPGTGAQSAYGYGNNNPANGGVYASQNPANPNAKNGAEYRKYYGSWIDPEDEPAKIVSQLEQPNYMNPGPSPVKYKSDVASGTLVGGSYGDVPRSYYYTTNYYYTSSPSQIPSATETVKPREESIKV